MKYIVGVKEVHHSYREVEADSPEKAIKLAGDAEEVGFDYSHTLDPDTWKVEFKNSSKGYCVKCGYLFTTHNSDGSCVKN